MDPKLKDVLQSLVTAINELTPLLMESTEPSNDHLRPEINNSKAKEVEIWDGPTTRDILISSAPTNTRFASLRKCFNLHQNSAPWVLELSNRIWEAYPHAFQAFGTLSTDNDDDGDGPKFTWSSDRPENLGGIAFVKGSDGYPLPDMMFTPRQPEPDGILDIWVERPAQGKLWTLSLRESGWLHLHNVFGDRHRGLHLRPQDLLLIYSMLFSISTPGFEDHIFKQFIFSFGHLESAHIMAAVQKSGLNRQPPEMVLQFHLRHFVRYQPPQLRRPAHPGEKMSSSKDDILLQRVRLKIEHHGGDLRHNYLVETGSSTILTMLLTSDAPYQILSLVDEKVRLPIRSDWDAHGIVPCGRCTGVAQFLAVMVLQVDIWYNGWKTTLEMIDEVVSVKMELTFDDKTWTNFMFDKSFQRSKTYFTVLETLRISRDWVEDVIKNWDGLGEQWSRLQTRGPNPIFHEADLRAMSHNWESITLAVHEKAQSLLDRIDRKTEEVKSLRDGLFNATSLREATKGMALNRAVYVFTIITVFYTPLGFMTAIWALPVLNKPGPDGNVGTPSLLIPSFIVVPLVTYLLSGALVTYFQFFKSKRNACGLMWRSWYRLKEELLRFPMWIFKARK